MMARAGAIRVWGPYQDGPSKYRLKIAEHGQEKSLCFKTREHAENVRAELLQSRGQKAGPTVGEVVEEFCESLSAVRGLKAESVTWAKEQLVGWVPLSRPIATLAEREACELYQAMVHKNSPKTGRPVAVATHQARLLMARRVFAFAIKAGYCHKNPWTAVTPIGRKNSGKAQLRIDEARQFATYAFREAQTGDTYALGALVMMYLGLRQGEVTARVARDLDDGGGVLWVPFGKNANARRRLNVPENLRPLLVELAKGKNPEARLFYSGQGTPHRGYFWSHVRRLCKSAGVPPVCPHSLRGLHATLALEGGATANAVAHALGHGSFAMTEKHYASPSSVANARGSRVADTLAGGSRKSPPELLQTLSGLPRAELAELFSKLGFKATESS